MGVFKGKTIKGLFLATRKWRRNSSTAKKHAIVYKCPLRRSTPKHPDRHASCFGTASVARLSPVRRKTPRPLRSKRRIVSTLKKSSPAKSPYKSPSRKKVCLSVGNKGVTPYKSKRSLTYGHTDSLGVYEDREHTYENDAEDTILYSDDCSETVSVGTCDDINGSDDDSNETNYEMFSEAMERLKTHNKGDELVTFMKLVVEGKFPLNNVAFLLFTDVVKWFSCDDTRCMRYSDTTMKFFWLGKKLFGSRFIRFMSGPKNETDFLTGSRALSPSSSKINFACPSDNILRSFHPLGCDFGDNDTKPGLIQPMIDLTASKNNTDMSYVIMFDGKKIKRGSDMDLLGFENEPLAVKKQVFHDDMHVIESTLSALQSANKAVENNQDIESSARNDLLDILVRCSKTVSKYLMELRQLRHVKSSTMRNYKEKISKDPSMAKTLEYAMDSCRTSCYQIDLCISQLLEIQMELCRMGSYLNGTISVFASTKFVEADHKKMLVCCAPTYPPKLALPKKCYGHFEENIFFSKI